MNKLRKKIRQLNQREANLTKAINEMYSTGILTDIYSQILLNVRWIRQHCEDMLKEESS